jgi:hypothetical protein
MRSEAAFFVKDVPRTISRNTLKMALTLPKTLHTFRPVIRNLNNRLLGDALLLRSAAVGF